MRRASVCAKVRLQIHHPLIGLYRVVQFPLFHQRIAEKTVIKAKSPLLDETPRQGFGFFKAMQILQHMRPQQHRFLALRIALFDAPRALLGKFVEAWVETFASLRHERPAESVEPEFNISALTNPLLKLGNLSVGATLAGLRR